MANTLNSLTTGSGGVQIACVDTSGNLNIQSGGVTKIAVTSAGVAVTGLSKASLPTGSVLQVVQVTYSTSMSTTSSTFSDTGLAATITPTSATSKILITFSQALAKRSSDTYVGLNLLRGASIICSPLVSGGYTGTTANNDFGIAGTSYLDSPATTSATTYKTQINSQTNLSVVYAQIGNATSTMILMEIAA